METFREVISGCILQHSPLSSRVVPVPRKSFTACPAGDVTRGSGQSGASVLGVQRRAPRASARRLDPVCSSSGTVNAQPSTDIRFKWTSSLSKQPMLDDALNEVLQGASAPLRDGDLKADIAIVFVSGAHAALDKAGRISARLRDHLPSLQCIFGASGMGVVGSLDGSPHEAEQKTAISLCLGCMPGVEAHTVHVTTDNLPDADASPEKWQSLLEVPIDTHRHTNFLLAGSPVFSQLQDLLAGIDFAYPEAAKLGGLCSGTAQHLPNLGEAGQAATARPTWPAFCWNADSARSTPASGVITEGCGVLVLHGNVQVEPLIAQGCRPMSDRTHTILKLKRNLVMEVAYTQAGRRRTTTALKALQLDLDGLGPDRRKAAQNVTIGLACDDFKAEDQLDASDFVVRGLVGASPVTGALLIGAEPHLGQRLRFLVRDKEGAMRDLQDHGMAHKRKALQATLEGKAEAPAFGALMFTCNGRGQGLYGQDHPHFDARTLHDFVPVPCAGFFCNGEIGQVGKSTYLHGFTCAIGILRELPQDDS